jgi:hypothetical protein
MEILKSKISPDHDNASFYTGVIAYGKAKNGRAYVLRSESEAEITLLGKHFYSAEIEQMGKNMRIDDSGLEDHNFEGINVLVDGWLTIAEARGIELEGVLYSEDQAEDRIFGFYDEAIEGFEKFLNKE